MTEIARVGGRSARSGASRIMGNFSGSAVRMGTLEGPTVTQREQLAELKSNFLTAAQDLDEARTGTIPALDRQLRRAGLPTILREGQR